MPPVLTAHLARPEQKGTRGPPDHPAHPEALPARKDLRVHRGSPECQGRRGLLDPEEPKGSLGCKALPAVKEYPVLLVRRGKAGQWEETAPSARQGRKEYQDPKGLLVDR